jgi:hypothetical protein
VFRRRVLLGEPADVVRGDDPVRGPAAPACGHARLLRSAAGQAGCRPPRGPSASPGALPVPQPGPCMPACLSWSNAKSSPSLKTTRRICAVIALVGDRSGSTGSCGSCTTARFSALVGPRAAAFPSRNRPSHAATRSWEARCRQIRRAYQGSRNVHRPDGIGLRPHTLTSGRRRSAIRRMRRVVS